MTPPTQRTVTLARGCVATPRTLRATTTKEGSKTEALWLSYLMAGEEEEEGASCLADFPSE